VLRTVPALPAKQGGCEPMEEERQILYIDWLTETIRCQEFKEKES
jgi:hypothetical protein